MKRMLAGLFISLLVVSCFFCSANADVPRFINYQGRLTDSGGKPLDGSYSIVFSIYDHPTADDVLLWRGTYAVIIQKGIFNVLLGGANDVPFNFSTLTFDKPYYLEIKVGSDAPMAPRQEMASAAYALSIENRVPRGVVAMWSGKIADIPSGWALCDGSNGTPDLRDKFIVGARQDDGGIIKTNVSGSLTQTGGEAAHTLTVNEIPDHGHKTRMMYGGSNISGRYLWDGNGNNTFHAGYDMQNPTGGIAEYSGLKAHNNLPPYYTLAYIMKL